VWELRVEKGQNLTACVGRKNKCAMPKGQGQKVKGGRLGGQGQTRSFEALNVKHLVKAVRGVKEKNAYRGETRSAREVNSGTRQLSPHYREGDRSPTSRPGGTERREGAER